MFSGEGGLFVPLQDQISYAVPTKWAWCAKKRDFRKVITRNGPTFVHEVHKLVPKSTLSTDGPLESSCQQPTTGWLVRGRRVQLVQLFFYFVWSQVFPITPPVEMNFKGTFMLSETVFGGEGRTDALSHAYASPRAALSRWQFPEAFFSLFFFVCFWQHRFYLIVLCWHQWQSHIAFEYVFTVCSRTEGQSDTMGLITWSICHNLHIEMQYYCHTIMSIKLCSLIKTLQVPMYHREQNQKCNLFLKWAKESFHPHVCMSSVPAYSFIHTGQ